MNRTCSAILDSHEYPVCVIWYHADVPAADTLAEIRIIGDVDVERLADAFVAAELVVGDVFSLV